MYDHSFRLDCGTITIEQALHRACESGMTRIVLADETGQELFAFASYLWGWMQATVRFFLPQTTYIACTAPTSGAYGELR